MSRNAFDELEREYNERQERLDLIRERKGTDFVVVDGYEFGYSLFQVNRPDSPARFLPARKKTT